MQKAFVNKYTNDKNYHKVRQHCHYTGTHRGAAPSICNLKYSIPTETTVPFRNGLNYDYHFIIRKLPKQFKGEFNGLEEYTEKYKIFSVPITKDV